MKRISQACLATTLFVLTFSQAALAEIRLVGYIPATAVSSTAGLVSFKQSACNAGPEYAPSSNDKSLFATASTPVSVDMSPQCAPTAAAHFVGNHLLSLFRSFSVSSSRTQAKIGFAIHF